jgi:hypothetical protein
MFVLFPYEPAETPVDANSSASTAAVPIAFADNLVKAIY